jgi:hypothetical protein
MTVFLVDTTYRLDEIGHRVTSSVSIYRRRGILAAAPLAVDGRENQRASNAEIAVAVFTKITAGQTMPSHALSALAEYLASVIPNTTVRDVRAPAARTRDERDSTMPPTRLASR